MRDSHTAPDRPTERVYVLRSAGGGIGTSEGCDGLRTALDLDETGRDLTPEADPNVDPNRHRHTSSGRTIRTRSTGSTTNQPIPCNRKVRGSSPRAGSRRNVDQKGL